MKSYQYAKGKHTCIYVTVLDTHGMSMRLIWDAPLIRHAIYIIPLAGRNPSSAEETPVFFARMKSRVK